MLNGWTFQISNHSPAIPRPSFDRLLGKNAPCMYRVRRRMQWTPTETHAKTSFAMSERKLAWVLLEVSKKLASTRWPSPKEILNFSNLFWASSQRRQPRPRNVSLISTLRRCEYTKKYEPDLGLNFDQTNLKLHRISTKLSVVSDNDMPTTRHCRKLSKILTEIENISIFLQNLISETTDTFSIFNSSVLWKYTNFPLGYKTMPTARSSGKHTTSGNEWNRSARLLFSFTLRICS
jgi:hypothetical protein